jgi:hypothetical protein
MSEVIVPRIKIMAKTTAVTNNPVKPPPSEQENSSSKIKIRAKKAIFLIQRFTLDSFFLPSQISSGASC